MMTSVGGWKGTSIGILALLLGCVFDSSGGGGPGPSSVGGSGSESTSNDPAGSGDGDSTTSAQGDTSKGTDSDTGVGSITTPTTGPASGSGDSTTGTVDPTTSDDAESTGPPPPPPGEWQPCDDQGQCENGLTCIQYPGWSICASPCNIGLECSMGIYVGTCSSAYNGSKLCVFDCTDWPHLCPPDLMCMDAGSRQFCGWPD